MALPDPATAAAKWSQRTQAATQDYADGVRRVTTAPGARAAAQKSKWQQNVANAADKWANRVGSVSLSDWQQAAAEKGAGRIAAGVQGAVPKMQAFLSDFLPHLEAGKRKVDAMPSTTFEQNVARMVEMARHNREFGQRRSR